MKVSQETFLQLCSYYCGYLIMILEGLREKDETLAGAMLRSLQRRGENLNSYLKELVNWQHFDLVKAEWDRLINVGPRLPDLEALFSCELFTSEDAASACEVDNNKNQPDIGMLLSCNEPGPCYELAPGWEEVPYIPHATMEDIEEGPGLIEPPTLFSKAFMGIGDEFPFQEDLLKVIGQKDDIAAREELIAQIKDKPKSVNILYPDENCDSTRLVFFNRTGEFLEMIDLGKGIASQETITKKAASIGNTRGRVMLVGYNWKSEVRKMQVKEVGKIPMRDIFEPLLQKTLFGDNGEALEELKEEGFIKLEHKNYKEQRLLAFHFENYGHEKKRLLESTLKEMMKSMEPSTEDEERWQLSYKSALKIFGIESGIKALSRFFIKDSQSGNYTINWEEVEKASFIYDICVIVSKASKVTASSYELCTLYYRQLILTSGGKGGSYKARKKNNASISF